MYPYGLRNPWSRPKFPRGLRVVLLVSLLCISSLSLTLISKDNGRSQQRVRVWTKTGTTRTNETGIIAMISPTRTSLKDECQCSRARVSSFRKPGLCSDWADSRGQGQRVISYSLYGNLQSSYFKGIRLNLEGVEQFYPGYTMRLYHNANESQSGFKELCDIFCQSNILDLCNVRHIEGYPDLEKQFGMLWRFLPLADQNVIELHSRDLDSRISAREVAAVHDWQYTGKHFHVMRDNPAHTSRILGGMFGVHITEDYFKTTSMIWNQMYRNSKDQPWRKGYDQNLLKICAWPYIENDLVVHDSYLCQRYPHPNNRPWPTKRIENEANNFVGSNGETYPNHDKHFGMIWRYLPLADPNVVEFHSRDLDSRISAREVAAVRDWQSSGKHFHVMRDNPAHSADILGGMFGDHITADYFNKSPRMFVKSKDYPWTKSFDQNLSNIYAWLYEQNDVLVYDSYLCQTYPNPNNRPWTSKRIENETNNFVGSDGRILNVQCPSFCRPANHQDWTYCLKVR
eukprot:TCALIF_05342-PA protein Name:"Protein of unknown function" AED:0.08 eAED:0.08 QI:58/0.25/0.2/1/0/0.4/5/0/512